MEFQYLKYFSSVADTLSFSEAAKKCRVSQPSLSAQIRILEDRLGTQLFHRTKRSVSLTKEGKALLPRVNKILLELEGLSVAAKELQDPFSGTLFVGATPLVPHSDVFDRLTSLGKKHSALKFAFTEGGSGALIDGLLSGQLDVIFLPYRERLTSPRVQFQVCERLEVRICSPKGTIDDIPFILIKRGCGLGEYMIEAARHFTKDDSQTLQATHVEMIKKWIQLGMGWSILPTNLLVPSDEVHFSVKKNKALKPIELCVAMLPGERANTVMKSFSV